MTKKNLILGAAGQIAQMLTDNLLTNSDYQLVLYGRNLSSRLTLTNSQRETIIDGDFNDHDKLIDALQGVDLVYLNAMSSAYDVQQIIAALDEAQVKRFIGATIVGVDNEFNTELGNWTKQHLNADYINEETKSAKLIENSDLNYTLLRLTWLYNDEQNHQYHFIPRGQTVNEAQVTRQAVSDAIVEVVNHSGKYQNESLAVVEPGTNFGKPSFY